MVVTVYPGKLKGEQVAPASKSSMQRACAAALLHKGTTIIHNPGHSNDDLAALDVIRKLGATVLAQASSLKITSNGVMPIEPEMNCAESGLGIRMFTPIAALSHQKIEIKGEGSLLKRPMHFFDEIFPSLGIKVNSKEGFLPISIQGPLKPINITVDGSLSSQFLTGLLMAYAGIEANGIEIKVEKLKSKPYINLTLNVLNKFGWNVKHDNHEVFTFLPHAPLAPLIEYTVEGDWSGAAFLLVAGATSGPIGIKGLQLDSTQADKEIIEALKRANAFMELSKDNIVIGPNVTGKLTAFEFDATDCPDLFPPLVCLAASCEGITKIKGVSRLSHKESDRGLTLQSEFNKMGLKIELHGDDMFIHGGVQIKASTVFSHHDHRICMACATSSLIADGPVIINDAQSVNKSYTDFFQHLQYLGAGVIIE